MALVLRPEQETLLRDARAAMGQGHRRVLCVLPTGGGKTETFISATKRAIERDRRVLILVHRKELLHQTIVRLMKAGLVSGEGKHVFASTIGRRTHFSPDLLIVDEAHHCVSPTWRKRIDAYDVPVLGWTATPERLDGRGLGEVFSAMVQGPTVAELMDLKRLSTYKLFAPPPDAAGGDGVFSGVRNWLKYAPGLRTIAFCVSVAHAEKTCEEFKTRGVQAEILDHRLTTTERLERIDRFKAGTTLVLVSVMLISEGFDVPACDCILLLRPTSSLSLYLQQVGRGLRYSDHPCVILDCVGTSQTELGLPDDFHAWCLEGKRVRVGQEAPAPPLKVCPRCFQVHRPGPSACPYCGHVYLVMAIVPPTVEADLEAVDVSPRRLAIRNARTEQELRRLAEERGYKPGFVEHILKARAARCAGRITGR